MAGGSLSMGFRNANDGPEYYNWNGVVVEAEAFGEGQEWDVSTLIPEHDTGIVPEGETHFLVQPPNDRNGGWWADESTFWEFAEPVSPSAIRRKEQREDE